MRGVDEEHVKRLLIISGILILSSFIISFLMVINVIPRTFFLLSFLTYALSFLGLNLFIYAYYQYTRVEEE